MKVEIKTLNDGLVTIIRDSFMQDNKKITVGEIEMPKERIKEVIIDGETVYKRKKSRI